jgi:hypothetical protein
MKILLSNNHFSEVGGSEVWVYNMAVSLNELGHEVDMFINEGVNKNSNVFMNQDQFNDNVNVFTVNPPVKKYDLIIANHTSTINKLLNFYSPDIMIQTCHGIVPELEQPHPVLKNFVSVSEEIQYHLQQKQKKSIVIPNSINCDLFKSQKPINKNLQSVLSLAQDFKAICVTKKACEILNLKLEHRSKFHKYTLSLQDEINKADLIISVGRGALEGLSCGRNVISLDSRSYYTSVIIGHGILNSEEKIKRAMLDNCTGRKNGQQFSVESLVNEMQKYKPEYGVMGRNFIVNNLNIKNAIEAYLSII